MQIFDLKITNFRGIKTAHVRLSPHTILIGSNNVGKTTLIEALALLFGRDRLVRELTEHDFRGSSPEPTDRIKLVASVIGFGSENFEDHFEWFRDGRGVPKYLDQQSGALNATRDNENWKLCCQIGFQARFDADALIVETARYFHDDDIEFDPFNSDGHANVPAKVIQQIGFYLVRASRTWDGVISFGSELFRRTIATAQAQPASAVLTERDRLRNPDAPIDRDDRIQPLVQSIDAELAHFLPRSPRLVLRVTTTDSRGLLEDVVAHFSSGNEIPLPAARQGSGLLSLQGLLLLLHFGKARIEAGEGFLLALEEPELHVPPPSQTRLMRRVQALATQTIITTHAPAVAALSDPNKLLILRNKGGNLSAEPLLTNRLTDDAPGWLRRMFLAGRQAVIAALMHETTLIPEGRSEHLFFQAIACSLDLRQGWTDPEDHSFSLEVGIVPTDDAKVVELHDLLAGLHDRICCLVDGDLEGDRYTELLLRHQLPPSRVLRWPDGWAIEEVAGWVVQADERLALQQLSTRENP